MSRPKSYRRPTTPERMEAIDSPPVVERTEETETPNALVGDVARIQRLTDMAAAVDQADAIASQVDDLQASNPSQLRELDVSRPDNSFVRNTLPQQAVPETNDPAAGRSIPRRRADATPLPQPYQLRVAPNRLNIVKRFGGNEQTEEAVQVALAWLAVQQANDGRWQAKRYGAGQGAKVDDHDREHAGANSDTAMTGLALLAFLGAGHTHLEGEYRRTVYNGLRFLTEVQGENGNLYGDARLFAKMYCHGIASLAISEAYAMTGDHRLRQAVKGAVHHTIESQDRSTGGWRYHPGDPGDMSQFGWQVMALKSAQHAGIETPGETRVGMLRFLRSVSLGKDRGLASYRPGDNKPSRTMTAEAVACRYFLQMNQHPSALAEAESFIIQSPPNDQRVNLYYWYYGTLALFPKQDSVWENWNVRLQKQLLQRQRRDGEFAGSWDTDTVWGGYGGRIYTTAMATLCLEVYYRYLPLYQ